MRNRSKHYPKDDQGRVTRVEQPEENKATGGHETRAQQVGSFSTDTIRNVSRQRYRKELKHSEQQNGIEQEASVHFQESRSVGKDEGCENIKRSLFRQSNQSGEED